VIDSHVFINTYGQTCVELKSFSSIALQLVSWLVTVAPTYNAI